MFNAGETRHGVVAWLVAVGGLVLSSPSWSISALAALGPPCHRLAGTSVVLYLTLGFGSSQPSFHGYPFARCMEDLPRGTRRPLSRRMARVFGGRDSRRPTCRVRRSKEALVASHRHVFGVLLCFILLPGPCGAVLYRAAAFHSRYLGAARGNRGRGRSASSRKAGGFAVIDWLPARHGGGFIVGNFEDAVLLLAEPGRPLGGQRPGRVRGRRLASGAGALGVRLSVPAGRTT